MSTRCWPVLLLCLAALSACSKPLPLRAPDALETKIVEADTAPQQQSEAPEQHLSYSHELSLGLPTERLAAAYQGLLDACAGVPQHGCVVMASRLNSGPFQSGSITLRVRRDAVAGLRKKIEGLGEVHSQATVAVDLSGPLVDTGRRLAMKKSLRDNLLELRARSQGQIDPLLKVTEKLAEVQAEIEADEGSLLQLRQRLATDKFQIEIMSSEVGRDQGPLLRSLRDFGAHMTQALSGLITFIAMSLPWLLLLLALPFAWRAAKRLWRLGRTQKTQ